ncbi:MAG: efflux transporter outer membrane subunit [Planctomycetes bacterium]|nr:efflux transporter outer membrane subunit [Planctomycetota bacterium]
MTIKPYTPGLVIGLSVIGGCAPVGPNYEPPDMHPPAEFAAATQPVATQPSTATQPAATQPDAQLTPPVDLKRWWETFHDPALNGLIDRAMTANLDVRLAQARVVEARAFLRLNKAALFPTLDADASYTRGHGGSDVPRAQPPGDQNLHHAGFDAGWEIDVFGGTRRSIESARNTLEAQIEAQRDTMVILLAEVARNYIALRGYQHELHIIHKNVAAQQETLDVMNQRLKAGIDTDLSVVQAESLLASTSARVPVLQTQIQQTIHELSVLLDKPPAALEEELAASAPLPQGPPVVPPGLPSELLRRRPDIRQAERLVAASNANIGVAVADLYPRFSLTGTAGLESLSLKDFANANSAFWSIGPSVTWRIFDAGQIKANIQVTEARQQQALIQYRQVVLRSLQEVEDALVAHDREQVRWRSLEQAVDANRRAVELATDLHKAGVVDFLNVLTAQQSLYLSEDLLAQSTRIVATNLIALYKALGGGWENTPAAEPPQPPPR